MDGFLDKAKEAADGLLDRTTLDEKATDAWEQHGDHVTDAVDQHSERIDQGIDQGGDLLNDRTGGRFEDQLGQGGDHLRDGLDRLDGQDDDFRAADVTPER